MITECTTHTVIFSGAGKQRLNLLCSSLRTTEPELEHALHYRRQIQIEKLFFDRFPIELLSCTALLLQPLE